MKKILKISGIVILLHFVFMISLLANKIDSIEYIDDNDTSATADISFTLFGDDKEAPWTDSVILQKMNVEQFNELQVEHELLVVSFWTSWCVPCREEIPQLIKFCTTNNLDLIFVSNDNILMEDKTKKIMYDTSNL